MSDDARATDGRARLGTATLHFQMNGQMSLASLPRLLRDDAGLTQAFGNPAALVAVPESARAVSDRRARQLGDRRPLLVATPTGTDAGQLYDDLCQFLPADAVELFPAWETLPFERVSPSVETMGRRLRGAVAAARPRALPRDRRRRRAGAGAAARPARRGRRADRRPPGRRASIPTSWSTRSSASATAARTRSSTAARSPGAARSSTCSRRPPTRRCASTCGATRSTG